MESNLTIKTPKLNVQNISSEVFGKTGSSMKNIHGTMSKLAGHVRKSLIRIGALEKRADNQQEKTTKIVNIIKQQKSNIGKKIPGGGGSIENELSEVNKTLVGIQKELSSYFSFQAKSEKQEQDKLSRDQSKKKLRAEESQLKSSSKKLGAAVKDSANNIVNPARGMFDTIMEFVGTLLLGIGANAVFEWLKDEENRKKIEGWFNWIKDHWQWGLVAIGALAALPLVSAIFGVVGTIGTLGSVLAAAVGPLLGLMMNPLFWKIALAIGAGYLIYRAGKFVINKVKDMVTGGEDFTAAREYLNSQLTKAGMRPDGRVDRGSYYRGRDADERNTSRTSEQEKLYSDVVAKRTQLETLKKQMRAEITAKQGTIKDSDLTVDTSSLMPGETNETRLAKARKAKLDEIEQTVMESYGSKITNILNEGNIETRKMGGSVKAGRPYIVGDQQGMSTAELFVPNVDGSIISNPKTKELTQQLYKNITSRKRGRGGVNISTLPMQTNVVPPPEVKIPDGGSATDVPEIASVNMADPYRNFVTANILGITVAA